MLARCSRIGSLCSLCPDMALDSWLVMENIVIHPMTQLRTGLCHHGNEGGGEKWFYTRFKAYLIVAG